MLDAAPLRSALLLLAAIGTVTPLAIDAYLPALPQIADYLQVELQLIESSVSTYMIGLAAGVLIGATVSDRLGRRPSVLGGLALFIVASLMIALTRDVDTFLALRVVQAFGGGFAFVNIPAIIRDVYEEQDSARALTMISVIAMIAPLIAPLLGAIILALLGWRAIFVALAVYALILTLLVRHYLPETSARRAATERAGVIHEISANVARVLRNREAVMLVLCQSAAFSVMFSFVADSAFVYMEHFGLSPTAFALLFGANIATLIGFNRLNKRLLVNRRPITIVPLGAAIQFAACIGLVGAAYTDHASLVVFVPLTMLAVGALGIYTPNTIARYMAQFGTGAGTASGVITCAQYLFAGLISLLAAALHDGTLRTTGITMLACSAGAGAALWAALRLRAQVQAAEAQ